MIPGWTILSLVLAIAGAGLLIDMAAVAIAAALLVASRSARYRARSGGRDSIWAAHSLG